MPGKFVVKKGSSGKFRFNLVSTNGQVVLTSEAYDSKAKCMNGVKSVQKLAADAAIDDQTAASTTTTTTTKTASARKTAKRTTKTAARSRRGTDTAMTVSEEELHVRKQRRPAERVRLKKDVVTEEARARVPVRREEARIEVEPITDANVDKALRGPEISEAEHEEILMEERVVPKKRVVPKERVRLVKETVTEEAEVAEEVRKERVRVARDDRTPRKARGLFRRRDS